MKDDKDIKIELLIEALRLTRRIIMKDAVLYNTHHKQMNKIDKIIDGDD